MAWQKRSIQNVFLSISSGKNMGTQKVMRWSSISGSRRITCISTGVKTLESLRVVVYNLLGKILRLRAVTGPAKTTRPASSCSASNRYL